MCRPERGRAVPNPGRRLARRAVAAVRMTAGLRRPADHAQAPGRASRPTARPDAGADGRPYAWTEWPGPATRACRPAGGSGSMADVAPYCETDPDALVRDDGSGMGIAFACCNDDGSGSSGCTRTVSGSCNAGPWNQPVNWAPVKWLTPASLRDVRQDPLRFVKCREVPEHRCHYNNNIYQWTKSVRARRRATCGLAHEKTELPLPSFLLLSSSRPIYKHASSTGPSPGTRRAPLHDPLLIRARDALRA